MIMVVNDNKIIVIANSDNNTDKMAASTLRGPAGPGNLKRKI